MGRKSSWVGKRRRGWGSSCRQGSYLGTQCLGRKSRCGHHPQPLVHQGQVAPEFSLGCQCYRTKIGSHVNHIHILASARGRASGEAEAENLVPLPPALSFRRPPLPARTAHRNSQALSGWRAWTPGAQRRGGRTLPPRPLGAQPRRQPPSPRSPSPQSRVRGLTGSVFCPKN